MSRHDTVKDMLPSLCRILKKCWPYILKQRALVTGSCLALFAEVLFRILEPWPLKFVFDRVIHRDGSVGTSGFEFLNGMNSMPLLVLSAVAIIIFTGFRALASYYNVVGFALVGNRVLTNVRSELYRHLQLLSLSFHTKKKSGDLIIRVISDVGMLKEVAVTALLPLIARIMVLVGMVTVMLWLNIKLALVLLSFFPLFWIIARRKGERIRQVSRKQRKREGAMAATAAESINAIKLVQALSMENIFNRNFSSHNQKSLKEGVQARRLTANLERTVDVLIALATALVVLYGARLVVHNELTPGDLLVFLAYLKTSFKPVRDFAKYTGRLAKASAAGDRILEVLETIPDISNLPGAVAAPVFQGALRFINVTFGYKPETPVLENIDFPVRPGEKIALVGPSGAGKSTMITLIMRLYDPDHGMVTIDGKDIREYTVSSLRSQMSIVLQDTNLFSASVLDNIAYGAHDSRMEEIKSAAVLANAHAFIQALPQGYDTELGERGATLSHGQRQRIAIARAAVRKAPILILDEPTTGLDSKNEQDVIDALEKLSKGRTTFIITHDMNLSARADRILYIEDGCICETGTHKELIYQKRRYAALFNIQAKAHNRTMEIKRPYAIR